MSQLEHPEEKIVRLYALTQQDRELSEHEREFVENTLKKMLSDKKKQVSEFEAVYRKQRLSPRSLRDLEHLKQLRKNVFYFCEEVINLVDEKLFPKAQSAQGRVFFLKVKGDFLRYSAECFKKGDSYYNHILQEGLKAYMSGYEIARNELHCEDSVYLSLCLNFSVFYYAIADDAVKSCELISKTLDQLERRKDLICPEIWRSVQPTVCLLRNNLLLWLSECEEEA